MAKSNYKIPFKGNERAKVQRLIRRAVERGDKPQQIYNKLKSENLGYRKQNLLFDIRLKRATMNAKSTPARRNSESWFINVFEKFRSDKKLNSKQAKKLWDNAVSESYKTVSDARLGVEMRELYRTKFKRPPKYDVSNQTKLAV